MTIDRIGPLDPVSKPNQTKQTEKTGKKTDKDSISFSSEARNMGEVYRAAEVAKNSPDIRMDRVEEVKQKLQDPDYINKKVVESVADSIMDLFGIN